MKGSEFIMKIGSFIFGIAISAAMCVATYYGYKIGQQYSNDEL